MVWCPLVWLFAISYSTVTSAGVLVWFWASGVWEAGPVPLSLHLLLADASGWNCCSGGRKCLRFNLRSKWDVRWDPAADTGVRAARLSPWLQASASLSLSFSLASVVHVHSGLWSSFQENGQEVTEPEMSLQRWVPHLKRQHRKIDSSLSLPKPVIFFIIITVHILVF